MNQMERQKQLKHFIRDAGSSLAIWKLIEGQKITHKSEGTATIVEIVKNKNNIYVTVQFRQVRIKYPGKTLLKHFTHFRFPIEVEKALETAHVNKGDFDRASVNNNKVMQPNLDDADAHIQQGLAYYNKGEYDRAIECYNKALKLKSDSASAYYNRGDAYRNKGDFDRAIEDCNRAIQLKPDYAEAYSHRGDAYRNKGDFDRAIEDCNRAIQLKPDYAEAYNNRGVAYRNKGDFDRAIKDYNKALKLKPNLAAVYNNRGYAYDKKGDFDRAIKDYNKALKLKQDYTKARKNRIEAYRNQSWNSKKEYLLNRLKNLASQPSIDQSTRNTFNAKYKQLIEMHPEQKLPEETNQEIEEYRQKLMVGIWNFEKEDLLRQLGDLASQPSINPSTLNTFNAKYKQLIEMHPEQKLPEETNQEIEEYRQRIRFSNLSEKTMNPNVRVCFSLPELNEHDLQLVGKWCHPPRANLDRVSLIEAESKDWDLGRLLSARSAEKVAVDFYRNYGKTVEDISITQIYENSEYDWTDYDLNVDGHPIDVKNSRQSQNSEDRYTEHCTKFKYSKTNQEVTIAGVFSPYLWAFELLDKPIEQHQNREIQFLGETTWKKLQTLKNEFNDLIDFAEPNPESKYFFPPWMFDYPKYVYTERDKALGELKGFPNFAFLKGAPFEFNLIPVTIAAGIDLTEILDSEALTPWERCFLNQLRNRIKKYGLSLPFLFLTILEHFLNMVAAPQTVPDFKPDKYRKFLFCEEFDKPLGIYDPLKTVDALIKALSILQTAEDGLIRKFRTFKLRSFNILQGKSNPNESSWTTLIAYCGGRLPKDGSACGKNPLILGESELCECRKLICPKCSFCCQTCKGDPNAGGIY